MPKFLFREGLFIDHHGISTIIDPYSTSASSCRYSNLVLERWIQLGGESDSPVNVCRYCSFNHEMIILHHLDYPGLFFKSQIDEVSIKIGIFMDFHLKKNHQIS